VCKTNPADVKDNFTWCCFTKNVSSVNMRKQWQNITGGFTMKLMKLQSPSLALAPSKALARALLICVTLSYVFEKFSKVRYLKHNRLSIMEICQAVINKQL
jgi:hypothetical protein